jgi:hypothetical protein
MKKLGMSVPAGAFKRVDDMAEMQENTHMQVSDCADLLICLAEMVGVS